MDGRQFLNVARFAIQESDEEWQRTAGGRAYYALFLEARNALINRGMTAIPKNQAHVFVRTRYSYTHSVDLRRIGNVLENLYNLRARADYEIAQSFFSTYIVDCAIDDSHEMIEMIDEIDADPVRRAAAVTAIRAIP